MKTFEALFAKFSLLVILPLMFSCSGQGDDNDLDTAVDSQKLGWPLACEIGKTCFNPIGFPDVDGDWVAFNCEYPGYLSHTGTDITDNDMSTGLSVYAAADGEVSWTLDGKFDQCDASTPTHQDCEEPSRSQGPGVSSGMMSCTASKPNYCNDPSSGQSCYWCTWGGNEVVIRHHSVPGVFATRYLHLRNGSIMVREGDYVVKGQKIAEMGSAGLSYAPHLHFEVLGNGYDNPIDPWAGECGPNTTTSLWESWIQETVENLPDPE